VPCRWAEKCSRINGLNARGWVEQLLSLSYSSVGNLMGNLLGSVMIEGRLARLTYLSLYKKHQLALHGLVWVALVSMINLMRLHTEPRLKLH
jgi:NADH:ubiquinone reductase (H+-translocating)